MLKTRKEKSFVLCSTTLFFFFTFFLRTTTCADPNGVTELNMITTTQIVSSSPKVLSQGNSSMAPGNWSVIDPSTQTRCIMVQMLMQMSIDYTTQNGSTSRMTLNVPSEALNVTGSCHQLNDTRQVISVRTAPVNLEMTFMRVSGTSYDLTGIRFDITAPNGSSTDRIRMNLVNGTLFKTNIGNSYYCQSLQQILAAANINVTVSRVHLEAFHDSSEFSFSSARHCTLHFSNLVEVAVGIALFSFIGVTLAVYFWMTRCQCISTPYEPLDEETAQRSQNADRNGEPEEEAPIVGT